MHLGLMMECETRTQATEQESFEEAFALAALAEESGLDAVWLAERHFSSPQRIQAGSGGGVASFASAPLVLASAIAARTSRLRIGIAVSVLPLSHPIKLAEEVTTLDHVSRGRLDFGVGRSGFQTSYEGYGVPYAESRERFQECLEILLEAWTQESFSYSGKHFAFADVCVVPKPFQKPHPPLRVAATTHDTFPAVGAMGYPIFVGLRGTDVAQTAAYLELYRQAWQAAGYPGNGDAYLRIPVFVAETADDAYQQPRASTMQSYQRLADGYARSAGQGGARSSEDRLQRGEQLASSGYDELLQNRLAYGTPDAVIERLSTIKRDLGLSGVIIEPNVGGATPREQVFRSVRLFADKVAPALR